MGVLDSVLQYKAQQETNANANTNAIASAFQNFQQARQQRIANEFMQKQFKAGLAEKGLKENGQGGFSRDESLMSLSDQLIQKAKLAESARTLGDRNLFNAITGQPMPEVNPVIDPLASAQQTIGKDTSNYLQYINEIDTFTGKSTARAEQAKQDMEIDKNVKETVLKDQTVRANKLTELNKIVDFFESKVNELPVGEGIGGKMQGEMQSLKGKMGLDPKAAAYEANLEGLRSQIARALGEVGNLNEGEQKAAKELLPKLSDNAETRKEKLKNVREYIQTKLAGITSAKIQNKQDSTKTSFDSVEEAEKADLPKGTVIEINGRKARVE